jgi:hypothetical protein
MKQRIVLLLAFGVSACAAYHPMSITPTAVQGEMRSRPEGFDTLIIGNSAPIYCSSCLIMRAGTDSGFVPLKSGTLVLPGDTVIAVEGATYAIEIDGEKVTFVPPAGADRWIEVIKE